MSWQEEEEISFQLLKEELVNAPILQGIEFGKEFTLEVDASFDGIRAVLSQFKDGKLQPVAYASRSL